MGSWLKRVQRCGGVCTFGVLRLRAARFAQDDGVLVCGDVGAEVGGDDGFEFGDVFADDFEVGAVVGEDRGDDVGDVGFGEVEEAVEFEEGDLGFDHPELGEVAAGFGFFGAEGGAEAVDLAEGEGGGFDVELAGLGEVGLVVVEVVHLEELGGAFAGVGGEDGWVGADEAVGVEVLGCGAHDGGADAEDGGLARGAEPEVAVLHEEVDAGFFELDGEGGFYGDLWMMSYVFDVEFEAAGGAGVGADFAGDGEAGFQGEVLEGVRRLLRGRRLWGRCPGWCRCRRGRWGREACPRRGGCRASRGG